MMKLCSCNHHSRRTRSDNADGFFRNILSTMEVIVRDQGKYHKAKPFQSQTDFKKTFQKSSLVVGKKQAVIILLF